MKRLPWIVEAEPFWTQFQEVAIDEKQDALSPGTIMRVRGQFAQGNRVTANGNLYPTDLLKREASRLSKELEEGGVIMLSGHPPLRLDGSTESPDPQRAVGVIRSLDVLPDGQVYGEADIGETDSGRNIAALIRMGAKIGVSTRARGTAQRVKMTDQHPLAKENPEWVGKEVNIINEDLFLKSADFVIEPASPGAHIQGYREGEEEDVDKFDITKLSEDQWKSILVHDKVKEHVAALVKEAVEAKDKEYEGKMAEAVKAQVDEFLRSEDFAKMLEAEETEDDKTEAKCPECKGGVGAGMKFCPSCGVKMVSSKKEGEEEDPKIEELTKQLKAATDAIEALKKEREEEQEGQRTEAKVAELLSTKPALVQAKARKILADKELTEENVEEKVKESVELVNEILEASGVNPEKLPLRETEETKEEEPTDELTEEQKAQQDILKGI